MAPAYLALIEGVLPILQNLFSIAAEHVAQGNHDDAHKTTAAAVAVGSAAVQAGEMYLGALKAQSAPSAPAAPAAPAQVP